MWQHDGHLAEEFLRLGNPCQGPSRHRCRPQPQATRQGRMRPWQIRGRVGDRRGSNSSARTRPADGPGAFLAVTGHLPCHSVRTFWRRFSHGELGRQACALKHRLCALTTLWQPISQVFVRPCALTAASVRTSRCGRAVPPARRARSHTTLAAAFGVGCVSALRSASQHAAQRGMSRRST
jgi:hypothetical protein